MQSYLLGLVPSSSSDALPFPSRPHALHCAARRGRIALVTAARGGDQDHYAVLGLPTDASAAEVKKAYRLLARKYHPDVSRDSQASEMFKSIRLAYEVLSNESKRYHYDREVKFQGTTRSHWGKASYDPELDLDDMRRIYKWAELRQQMRYEYYKHRAKAPRVHVEDADEEIIDDERGPFAEVVWFAFSTLFFMQMIGSRLTLTLCVLTAILDQRLDAGYKMGYVIAWILGGPAGILLSLCISFVSWLCGKNNSGVVALLVLAMWVGVHVSRFVPIPQGAVLALLYMSIKFQVN